MLPAGTGVPGVPSSSAHICSTREGKKGPTLGRLDARPRPWPPALGPRRQVLLCDARVPRAGSFPLCPPASAGAGGVAWPSRARSLSLSLSRLWQNPLNITLTVLTVCACGFQQHKVQSHGQASHLILGAWLRTGGCYPEGPVLTGGARAQALRPARAPHAGVFQSRAPGAPWPSCCPPGPSPSLAKVRATEARGSESCSPPPP